MKKLIAMFLAALTALSLTACAAKSGAQPDASEIPDALTILNTAGNFSSGQAIPKTKNSLRRAAIIPKPT